MRNAYIISVRTFEEKRLFGRPGYKWENNNEIYMKWNVRVWIGFSAQDKDQGWALVKSLMNLQTP
jgi:hypothetical protein